MKKVYWWEGKGAWKGGRGSERRKTEKDRKEERGKEEEARLEHMGKRDRERVGRRRWEEGEGER